MKTSKDLSLLEKTKIAFKEAKKLQDKQEQFNCYFRILNDKIIVIIYE
jgi:hypothetical protein